jgi:hypothetical protein
MKDLPDPRADRKDGQAAPDPAEEVEGEALTAEKKAPRRVQRRGA